MESIVVGDESVLEKLLGRQILGLAFVPEADAAMIQFDAETAVFFRIVNGSLQIEVEAPSIQ